MSEVKDITLMSMSTPELDYARTKALEEVVRLRRENQELRQREWQWNSEREFIQQIELWLGADAHGSIGTGIKAAIDRLRNEAAYIRGLKADSARLAEALAVINQLSGLWDVLDEVIDRLRGLDLCVLAERVEGAMGRVRR